MVVIVQRIRRRWRVLQPSGAHGQDYERGADAYDEAARLAREHHERTGNTSFVRVQTFEASVEAARFG